MAAATFTDFDTLCVNTIRVLSADQPSAAKSGHPGAPMGMAPIAHLLWSRFMKYAPSNPKWFNRDRFVLSNGHACALLYSMLHLTGYNYTIDDLKSFRQLDSKTPGHPEAFHEGVEVTTGPLGQGMSSAVGIAIAERHLAARFHRPGFEDLINYKVFVTCGDGCLMEGITAEAASLAGHLGLSNLVLLYDDNGITIDGHTDLAFTEDVGKRFESYGWHVIIVKDGDHDLAGLYSAIDEARRQTDRPTLIKVRTTIGFGSAKQGEEAVHGTPLSEDDLANVKKKFGLDPTKKFYVPEEVRKFYSSFRERGQELEAAWNARLEAYVAAFPAEGAELKRRISGHLTDGWQDVLPRYKPTDPAVATRKLSQTCIQKLAAVLPELVGGSADLNPSTFTYIESSTDFQKATPAGRNIRFGVREHAMSAILNGLASNGGIIPYGSTFLNFIGYAYGAVILSALSQFRALYIMTHDSIGLGEDGPTHQPVEKLLTVRSTPNILLLRPADGNEVSGAYIAAIGNAHRPSVLALSRQNVPHIEGTSVEGVLRGAYVVQDSEGGAPEIILAGTGTELSLCVDARKKLVAAGRRVRVVSFPSWELFDEQPLEYRESVLLPGVPAISVEASTIVGWSKYVHGSIGMTTFGASGPYQAVYKKLGITVDNIVEKTNVTLEFYAKAGPAPNLVRKPF